MRKRNLIFPLVVSSLFMPSIEALDRTTDLNSLENENNIYEAVDIFIAEGGGGGNKTKQQEENIINNTEKAKELFRKKQCEDVPKKLIGFERQLIDKTRLGKSTEKTLKKIKEYEQLLAKCEDTKTLSKKERQKQAQEIRKRQKVINEKGYFPYWADKRKKVLIEKTKISNEPIGKGDFFKLLDEKMAKLKYLEIMLNLIDECQLYQATDLKQEKILPESLDKARTRFFNEKDKVYSLFSEEFQREISNLDFYVSFGFAILTDDR